MRFQTLDEWLAWQETAHSSAIDLGLERVGAVARQLGLTTPPHPVITVAGTNGKGSCVAYLEAIYRAAGYRVGAYTSPHLVRYNERVRIDGEPVGDTVLCEAFARIDEARGETSLSYFEFGTLAALEIFRQHGVDVALLEVGLGGRLDAVNILDADLALITSIGIDHVEWLGGDRESIGREKAGIMRGDRPAVCGDLNPPASLLAHAASVGAQLYRLGEEFDCERDDDGWSWAYDDLVHEELPAPALAGSVQYDNAASVLMGVELLRERLPVARRDIEAGLLTARLAGRMQRIAGPAETVLDVAHNPDSARSLAEALAADPVSGQTWVVFSVLADKDLEAIVEPFVHRVDGWYVGGLDVARGRPTGAMADELQALVPAGVHVERHPTVFEAYEAARRQAAPGDRIVVFGSFYTVAAVLNHVV